MNRAWIVAFSIVLICGFSFVLETESAAANNVAIRWTDHFFKVIQQTRTQGPIRPGPTKVARSGSILFSCMYDAYVAFYPQSLPYSGERLRHSVPRSQANVDEAISYAAHHALSYIYGRTDPVLQENIDTQLSSAGYRLSRVGDMSMNKPSGVGLAACHHIVKDRDNDGSNALGTEPTAAPIPYADYTNYAPTNDPFPFFAKTDCSKVKDVDRWQPALVKSENGSLVVQRWGDVHFTNMQPFGMVDALEFRVVAPSRNNTRTQAAWYQKWAEIVEAYESLDDRKKTILYYWDQGTNNLSPTGLLFQLTLDSLKLSRADLKKSIQALFVIGHAQLDAMISQFANKRYWDPPRPTTPIQCIYQGETIQSWLGPYKGVGPMDGSDWRAYLPDTIVQNGTPEYPCGHCTISGAWTAVSQYFFGEEFVGNSFTLEEGKLPLERKITDPTDPKYVAGLTDVPNRGPRTQGYAPGAPVTLSWRTFEEAGNQVGDARVFNGVHTYESHNIAFSLGKRVAGRVIQKASQLFKGREFKIIHDLLP